MNTKMLTLLGIILSGILVYFCINNKKDALYTELTTEEVDPTQKQAKAPELAVAAPTPTAHQLQENIATVSPSFAYIVGEKDKIVGLLSPKDKETQLQKELTSLCQNDTCLQNIQYSEKIKPFGETKEVISLITYAKEQKIPNFALYVDKGTVKVEGEVHDGEQKEKIKTYLASLQDKGYQAINTMQMHKVAEEKTGIIKEEIVQNDAKEELVTPHHRSIKEASDSINDILKKATITFNYRSSEISKESKKTLDEVIDILLALDNVTIEAAGYTDSKGDGIYNKVLSQKRADAVASYLVKSGVRTELIKSVGYGEENPISDPKDIINRRVEIHLKEGE